MTLDLFLVAAGLISAYWIKKFLPTPIQGLVVDPNYYMVLLLLLVASFFTFHIFNTHMVYVQERFRKKAARIISANVAALGLLIVSLYIFHIQNVSRLLLFLSCGLAIVFILSRYLIMRRIVFRSPSLQKRALQILVVGSRERAKEMIKAIDGSCNRYYKVIGCLEVSGEEVGKTVFRDVAVIGEIKDFKKILLRQVVDEVIFALPLNIIPNVAAHIAFAEELGVEIRIMPNWQIQTIMFTPETASISFEDFMGMPTLILASSPPDDFGLLVKAIMDFTLSLAGVIILSPLFLIIILAIKATSKGPVFFKQVRSGLNGRHFEVYKFTTMVENAEELKAQLKAANEMDGPVFKIKDDPRVTPLGSFLRKTSLDELPQLFNVLKGEMSLVGPRPPLPSEVKKYRPSQRRRLSMKPGITCFWQVMGRNNINFEQWMKLDLEYIDTWSLWLDCKLLILTVRAVVKGTGH